MSNQRPFFLSNLFAAFRPHNPSMPSQQPNKHSSQPSSHSPTYQTTSSRSISSAAAAAAAASAATSQQASSSPSRGAQSPSPSTAQSPPGTSSVVNQFSAAARGSAAIPVPGASRRRGSDSSSEGFRDVRGMDKWYVGGRTATGEERFFKLGMIKRVRSNDGLSLDKMSL